MERRTVTSSNIKSIGYDSTTNVLEVEFNTGAVYQYNGVPEEIYNSFVNASSIGKYFITFIKGKYPTTKIN